MTAHNKPTSIHSGTIAESKSFLKEITLHYVINQLFDLSFPDL
jgi:hypothetical protein